MGKTSVGFPTVLVTICGLGSDCRSYLDMQETLRFSQKLARPLRSEKSKEGSSGEGHGRETLLKAAETRRLHRQIADHLRELIDQGEYPIGGRLPSERELADRLCVSRPSVREALIVLEVEGRIRINGGSGIYVMGNSEPGSAGSPDEIPPDGSLDLLHARAVVEPAVAAQAATLAEHRHTENLNRILSRMDERGGCADSWVALDREFHLAVAAILENGVLVRLVGQLFDRRQNRPFKRSAERLDDATSRRRALAEHRAISAAIAGGDAEGARRVMSLHLRPSQERFSSDVAEPSSPGRPARRVTSSRGSRAATRTSCTQQSTHATTNRRNTI